MIELRFQKPLNLAQLTEEIRALPALEQMTGLSARGPLDGTAEATLIVHADDALLTGELRSAVERVLADHVPDASWGLSEEERSLRELAARPSGTLTLSEVEQGLRLLLQTMKLLGDEP